MKRKRLTKKQSDFIAASFKYRTIKEAAESVNVSPVTVSGWQAESFFMESWRNAQSQLLAAAVSSIAGELSDYAKTLYEVAGADESKGSEKVAAVKAAFDLVFKANDVLKLQAEHEQLKLEVEEIKKALVDGNQQSGSRS